jgi:23S rRNA (cytosine1962-C5)-methyltransferase
MPMAPRGVVTVRVRESKLLPMTPKQVEAMRGAVSDDAARRQAEMLANRVSKSLRRWRRKFEREKVGAFRLYDHDIPEVRIVVDWYEGHVVVAEYERAQTRFVDDWLGQMGAAVVDKLGLPSDRLHLKRRRTRPSSGERYQRLGEAQRRIEVREGAQRFLVNLDDYVDTGLFADHRETRRLVGAESAGRSVLNLYAYTGTFSCYAAAGGATRTTNVDLSRSYLAWARDNFLLNGVDADQHEFLALDVPRFLADARRTGRRWDLVVCDPPSFSTVGGPRGRFDVQRDHPWLLEQVLRAVAPGGTLYFSTNHQRFYPLLDRVPAARVEELTRRTVPPDFRNRRAHRCWRIEAEPAG